MIWYNKNASVDMLNALNKGTMGEHLNISFKEIGLDYLIAEMPVTPIVQQPFGLLHGGASAALAETIGSVASLLCINTEKQSCVGIEINCNHLRGVRDGIVIAKVMPFHIGASTHVWDIRISNDRGQLVCVSRLTVSVIRRAATL
jgi:1,4-dihydroxy-2-naphthoyl-CoA hydrolase